MTAQRTLRLAMRILGGKTAACERWGVSASDLESWICSDVAPPELALMRALDVILEDPHRAALHAAILSKETEEEFRVRECD